jgi:hypothetical protein
VAQPLSADADAGMAPGAPVVGPGGAVAVPRDRRLGPATVGTAGPVSTPPTIVPPTTLEELRIQGDKQILPDDATRLEIAEAGVRRLVIPFRLCVDVDGAVSEVALLKASGFPAYDAKLADAMWLWRYQPYQIDGAAVPVCAVVQFQYSQRWTRDARPCRRVAGARVATSRRRRAAQRPAFDSDCQT